MFHKDPDPFVFQCLARIWAVGRLGKAGTVMIQDEGVSGSVDLPPGEFDVFAILLEAAQRDPPEGTWAPTGFLTKEELCRELKRRAAGRPGFPLTDPEGVIRTIFRIRKRIAQAFFPEGKGADYAKQLLETKSLGYRISVPADHIEFVLLSETDTGSGPSVAPPTA